MRAVFLTGRLTYLSFPPGMGQLREPIRATFDKMYLERVKN